MFGGGGTGLTPLPNLRIVDRVWTGNRKYQGYESFGGIVKGLYLSWQLKDCIGNWPNVITKKCSKRLR